MARLCRRSRENPGRRRSTNVSDSRRTAGRVGDRLFWLVDDLSIGFASEIRQPKCGNCDDQRDEQKRNRYKGGLLAIHERAWGMDAPSPL